ncbi:ERF family protein [Gluconobacter oxydans]|uniref:ERF family protein n=1 Tax=Gluconobacter oxydans NBRC 3293 TaxID=1315969 RepID=A0A829WY03_GLUOY|nr:ERF family protein [Gluconobacter oxydans]GEM18003.1 ERF family protein [Gluconobacter oxydans NBRC 3293]
MSEVIERPMGQNVAEKGQMPPQAATMMQVIASAAANPDCDIEKMQALLNMQSQLIEREARAEFSAAMATACGAIPQVNRNGVVSLGQKGGYKFTKWEDMDKVIRPILAENNLRLSFNTRSSENSGAKVIVGTISHANGQSQSAEIELPLDAGQGRNALQGFGSTISYGKRYCAEMLLNIVRCDEDTDGRYQSRQPTDVITAEQKEEIIGLLQESGKDTGQFLAWVGTKTLDAMTLPQFEKGKRGLLRAINGAVQS